MRPVKGKTYQDHTFALSIFHLSLMMTILITSRWNTFLDCSSFVKTYKLLPHTHMGEPLLWEGLHISMNLLVEDLQIAPPHSYGRASYLGTSSYINDPHEDGKLHAYLEGTH